MNKDAMQSIFENATRFAKYLFDHWMTVVILCVSATQTFYLVDIFNPEWAAWLPFLGVCLMEGGYLYWRWREYEADPLDVQGKGNSNKQEEIANWMVYITLASSGFTMIAGAFLEIANADVQIFLSDPGFANMMGLFAIALIFLLAVAQLYADWQYRRYDPDAVLAREYRKAERELDRERWKADHEGQKIVMRGRNQRLSAMYSEKGEGIGARQAEAEFNAKNGQKTRSNFNANHENVVYAAETTANPTTPAQKRD